MFLNLPNPPGYSVNRGYAGGFGTLVHGSDETLLPIYLLYAASAALKAGCDYRVLDAQALRYNSLQVVEAVKTNHPDILISWISLPSMRNDIGILTHIKNAIPSILIVALGAVCNVLPEEILISNSIDLIVKGKYPYYKLILNLIDTFKQKPFGLNAFDKIGAMYRQNGHLVQKLENIYDEDLNNLSLEAYYQLPVKRYLSKVTDARGKIITYIPLLTSIGCPNLCMYCPYPIGYGRMVLYKSIGKIIEEMEFLKINFNIRGFLFRDQLFTHDQERVKGLCNSIINRNLNIKWFVEARVDEVSRELLHQMKEAGCFRIHYGVETGTPEMLEKEGKPGVQIQTVKNAFMATKECGIAAAAFMIIGLPGENEATIRNSLNLMHEIRPQNAIFNIATPYPGTRLYKIAKERGWISTYDWSRYTSFNALISTEELNIAQIAKSTQKITRDFRNFKLLTDPVFRKIYIMALIRSMYYRFKIWFNFR